MNSLNGPHFVLAFHGSIAPLFSQIFRLPFPLVLCCEFFILKRIELFMTSTLRDLLLRMYPRSSIPSLDVGEL